MQDFHYDTLYRTEQYHWWYRVRRKIITHLIKKYAGINSGLNILDVGCGTGTLLKELQYFGKVYGIDSSEIAVGLCGRRELADVVLGDIAKISYPDNFFDVVLALDVMEHIKDDMAGIKEMLRVLKPGGVAIIVVPAFNFLWGTSDIISNHLRRYTLDSVLFYIVFLQL